MGDGVIDLALHRLSKAHLLSEPMGPPAARTARSRRDLLRRAAAVGGLTILAITAPTTGQAATCLPNGTCVDSHCSANGRTCCSNNCKQNSMACGTGQTGFQCQ